MELFTFQILEIKALGIDSEQALLYLGLYVGSSVPDRVFVLMCSSRVQVVGVTGFVRAVYGSPLSLESLRNLTYLSGCNWAEPLTLKTLSSKFWW